MKVIIDGVEYIPAKEAIANRDAVIRGLLSSFWGELGKEYDENDKCSDVYVFVTDDSRFTGNRTVQQVADDIAKFA